MQNDLSTNRVLLCKVNVLLEALTMVHFEHVVQATAQFSSRSVCDGVGVANGQRMQLCSMSPCVCLRLLCLPCCFRPLACMLQVP